MPLPKIIIERPPSSPAKFGILSAAVVLDQTDAHAAVGVQWEQDYCGGARGTLAACLQTPSSFIVQVNDADLHVNRSGGAGFDHNDAVLTVDWGDGNTSTGTWDDIGTVFDHTYAAPGDYTITVTGEPPYNLNGSFDITIADPPGDPDPHTVDGTLYYTPANLSYDDRAGWSESHPFDLYHLSHCYLPGIQDRVAYAERALRSGEGRGIEQALEGVFTAEDTEASMTVLNGGAAASWVTALARVEAYAFQNYGGTPVIYMHRSVASVLTTANALEVVGDKLMTKLGSLVVAGTGTDGYFPGSPWSLGTDAPGNTWMFATGTLVVTRQPINTTPEVISDSTGAILAGAGITNEYLVLAERQGSVGWECFLVGHQVEAVSDTADLPGGGVDGGTP